MLPPDSLVLYAEDDFANRKLLELQLRKQGITCISVDDGSKALEELKKRAFPLVILDINMPGLSGTETLKALRSLNPRQKVLALTSDDSLIPELLAQGFDRVIIKPVTDDSLILTIRQYLESPGTH